MYCNGSCQCEGGWSCGAGQPVLVLAGCLMYVMGCLGDLDELIVSSVSGAAQFTSAHHPNVPLHTIPPNIINTLATVSSGQVEFGHFVSQKSVGSSKSFDSSGHSCYKLTFRGQLGRTNIFWKCPLYHIVVTISNVTHLVPPGTILFHCTVQSDMRIVNCSLLYSSSLSLDTVANRKQLRWQTDTINDTSTT